MASDGDGDGAGDVKSEGGDELPTAAERKDEPLSDLDGGDGRAKAGGAAVAGAAAAAKRGALDSDDGMKPLPKDSYAVAPVSLSSSMMPRARRGRMVRQLLTSRRGQRPSAWIDWEEARNTMLGWDGYKILAVARHASDATPVTPS